MDTSLVDQTCLMDKCSLQSKACLVDDPSCRKGLTCTAKCMGDNACITGCMARYGNSHLDDLLKCTIEDNECIKVAILPGGADAPGDEKPSPIKTVKDFKMASLEGRWFKVVGFNPNYDCYACQRNTFTHASVDSLDVAVEFSMPRLLEDGSPPPPTNRAEKIFVDSSGSVTGGRAIQLNDYKTTEKVRFRFMNCITPSPSNEAPLHLHLQLHIASSDGLRHTTHPQEHGPLLVPNFPGVNELCPHGSLGG